jgi:small subunit ribosomal protein S9
MTKEEEKIEIKEAIIDDDDFVVNENDFKDLGDKYFEGVGRRKTSVARVRLYTKGDKDILVNDVDYKEYFKIANHQLIILDSLEKMKSIGRFRVVATVKGGGIHSQAWKF